MQDPALLRCCASVPADPWFKRAAPVPLKPPRSALLRVSAAAFGGLKQSALVLIAMTVAGPARPAAAQVKCAPTVSGEVRVESLQSVTYGDTRTLRIWLPAGYDSAENAQKRYPVLYMFDGQTLFDTCTAFKGEQELHIDETLTRLIRDNTVPPMIVVGMDSGSRRTHEYRPYRDTIADPAAPEPIGKELPAFVVNDVVPHVSARYRVTSDPVQTGIGGTSLGAIAALYVLLNRPDRFGIGLLESPSVPLGNGQMLRDTAFLARGPDRISIGVGSTELAVPQGDKFAAQLRIPLAMANAGFAKMVEALAGNLRAAYLNRPEVTLVVEPNGNHTSASWARRLPHALTVLYGTRGPAERASGERRRNSRADSRSGNAGELQLFDFHTVSQVTPPPIVHAFTDRAPAQPPLKPDAAGESGFVPVAAGAFAMGSATGGDNEKPPHRVVISRDFEIGRHEVTQTQWEALMGSNPSRFKGADRPVEGVSWDDVQLFIRKINARNDGYVYRLPTDAEWEYAARAGSTTDYAGTGNLDEMGWHFGNSGGTTHPVGSKKPNAWGLYDTHGNVWEWVQDWYDKEYYNISPSMDPSGPVTGSRKVCRGGAWNYGADRSTSSSRAHPAPSARDSFIGFRLVRTRTQDL